MHFGSYMEYWCTSTRRVIRFKNITVYFSFLLLFCMSHGDFPANGLSYCVSETEFGSALNLQDDDHRLQSLNYMDSTREEMVDNKGSMGSTRKLLSGPGSWPPRCNWRCGRCQPCRPVHVPVPPGTPVTMEYYPEAWRCKCGNTLYMP